MSGKVIDAGGGADAHERKPVCGADDDAFFVFLRTVLDRGADRHNEKSAEESQRGQEQEHGPEGQVGNRQAESEDCHAHRAERNQSVFNFSGGEVTRGETAEAYPDRNGRLEEAALGGTDMQDVLPVNENVELQQASDKEEIRVAEDRQPQHPIAANQFHRGPDIDQRD